MIDRRVRQLTGALVAVVLVCLVAGPAAAAPVGAGITVSPNVGPPTSTVTVDGRGYGPSEMVDVLFDGLQLTVAQADSNGQFQESIEVPDEALPGKHQVEAVGETSGLKADASFTVRTDWARYRFDTGGSGFNPHENVLDPSNVGRLRLSWRVRVGDYEAPDPIVVGGVLYAVSHFGEAYGLDAETGDLVWKVEIGALTNADAPVVSGGILYVDTLNGDVIAYSLATRLELWRTNVGGPIRTTMLLSDGLIYVNGDELGLEALDADTGALVWTNPSVIANNTPSVGNGLLYVGDDSPAIWALDPATGVMVWKKPLSCSCYLDSQVVTAEGVVAAGTDTKVRVWDGLTGDLLWAADVGQYADTPALADGVLYVTALTGQYEPTRAFDLMTGSLLWKSYIATDGYETIVANGVVYVGMDDRRMYALDSGTGATLWRGLVMKLFPQGVPAVANGILYSSDSAGYVYAFALP